jgi:hypothetical protein
MAKEAVMTQAEVKASIERNLIAARLPIENLRVQPDIFLGWLIVVADIGEGNLSK